MREAMLRWSFFFGGLIILGLGVALTIKGQRFGVGSWDVFHIGLFKQLGLTIGTWSIIAGIVIVIISAIGMREFPKIGTFINMTTVRSEEHTSELQSRGHLVCRLLLEKKKKQNKYDKHISN